MAARTSDRRVRRLALRRLAPIVVAVWPVLGAAPAHADEGLATASLEWREPPRSPCVSRDALVSAVERRLKRRVFADAPEPDVRLRVTIVATDGVWGADLELRDGAGAPLGTRRVRNRGPDCGGLAEKLAVVVSLLIDLPRRDVAILREQEAPSTTPRPPPPPPPPPSPAPVAPRADTPVGPVASRAVPSPITVRAAVEGDAASGLLPGVTLGGTVYAGLLVRGGWAFEMGGGATAPSTAEAGGGSARFTSAHGAVAACAPLAGARLTFAVCVGARIAAVLAEGRGLDHDATTTRLLPDVGAGVRAEAALGPSLFLRLDVGAAVPLVRDRFVFRASTGEPVLLLQASAIVPRAGFGVGFRFF